MLSDEPTDFRDVQTPFTLFLLTYVSVLTALSLVLAGS
jgi:hypothetical protein